MPMSAQHDCHPLGTSGSAAMTLNRQIDPNFPAYLSGYMFEVFLYGINSLLFAAVMFILLGRKEGLSRPALLAAAIAMFLVTTSNISLSIYILFHDLIPCGFVKTSALIRAKHTLMFVGSAIADSLLIYRCYAVWSRSLYAIAAPCAMLLTLTIYGAIFMPGPVDEVRSSKEHVFLWLALSLNVLITTLTATRIWWMARQVRVLLGHDFAKKHYSVVATTIETGAIYAAYILVYQILSEIGIHLLVLDIALSQVAVISPMLIIVQAGLGLQIRDIETTLRLENRPSATVFTTVNSSV
ncbi:hypothetical protein D9756_002754 [Leucocoprinus leucothites]|uniref:Uncharacterized protein n=1 Tax=Leucocoprinus leucothites TaxID=201217 RepID=A0A8H5GCG3_9AGAR|nr:hypothetical protein D9756_002754 [Leucoagaricus leucothites]